MMTCNNNGCDDYKTARAGLTGPAGELCCIGVCFLYCTCMHVATEVQQKLLNVVRQFTVPAADY